MVVERENDRVSFAMSPFAMLIGKFRGETGGKKTGKKVAPAEAGSAKRRKVARYVNTEMET